MFVEYSDEIPPGREHPWTPPDNNPEAKYCDFKAQPEQIPLVLEDFKPWAHYPGIPRFYELLAWLNGSESVLESNDCGLRPPRRDQATPDPIRQVFDSDPIVIHGRLTIIFRNLVWNTSPPTIAALKKHIHDGLLNSTNNFPSCVKVGEWAHLFTAINKEGNAVILTFWAWGGDEAQAMENLRATFDLIHGCLKWISDGVTRQRTEQSQGL